HNPGETIDSPEQSINLFHCLNELGDRSLVAEIQQYLKSGNLSEAKLSSSQWAAVVFVLLTSEEELNEFRLDKFVKGKNNPENMKVLQKLLPVIKESRSVQLSNCGVTDEGCAALASALRSNPSHLRELSLSENKLGDSVKLLSDVLQNPHCKLEKLRLRDCGVTDEGCAALASALRSNPSHLRQLHLSGNKLGDSVKLLSDVLQNPHCKLEKLCEECVIVLYRLSDCGITDEGCAALASALRSNPSHLRELSLSWNKLGDSVKLLSDVLQNPHCKLEKLRTDHIPCPSLSYILRKHYLRKDGSSKWNREHVAPVKQMSSCRCLLEEHVTVSADRSVLISLSNNISNSALCVCSVLKHMTVSNSTIEHQHA
uniref:NACHT LRR and PYD domain-containing protein n=1 Tax=Sinocyclocheilus grahami TaxID=75366 RepID=A0A672SK52_SINGR